MKFILTLTFGCLLNLAGQGQKLAEFSVPPHEAVGPLIVTADLSKIPADLHQISLVKKDSREPVAFQLSGQKIVWKISEKEASQYLEYEIHHALQKAIKNDLHVKKEEGQLAIYQNDTKLLGYQMDIKDVPAGVNPAFARSGFIHPLNTPSGKRLTRIQPKDHYHHYGLWNPWTHVEYEGDTLDFWNLNKEEGTVRFAKLIYETTGSVFSEYEVLQEHVVLHGDKKEVALNETQTVRLYPLNDHSYIADFTITYNCATESPFKILEYRYAGFGWRTTEEWDNQNSTVLSSEGKTRKDADGTTARWCIVQGKLGTGNGGAIMLSHPQNYNHPEPLRIWPENQYGRGDMFANFAPTKTKDWTVEPGKNYTLRYQMLVFDGEMTASQAEAAWQQFAKPIEIKL
ncbi:DUF6807 domain-containing protein [Jiulongibacter sediminis]|uniref:Methane oxygenase PmoA n=1 Tax=Jiulongibacter sediminis TaxID=1605367 RepID=A0A0P7BUF3_9BACT|nr:PmoA family protein [Jiulongibacter sediminis]KPM48392.1 hypothetical protein AFM12_07045 [Jiulongibacter sediminis]TBX24932.1 hypothetical protein TK44_07050 [Jiulongibacter sediminis]